MVRGLAPPPVEAEYKPLDDTLRGEIREILARRAAIEPAQKNLESAVEQAKSEVERYARQLAQSRLLEGREPPAPFDFEAIAAEHKLTYQQTPLIDQLDIGQIQRLEPADDDPPHYGFLRATETFFGQQTGMIRRTIMDMGFAGDVDLFKPSRLVDGMLSQGGFQIPPEKLFVYWRREVVPERVPPFDEIRDEVIRAWKLRRALPMAQDRAAEMARRAAEADQPLVEVFPESASSVIRTTAFSWMTRGAMPGSMGGRPMLSPVNGMAGSQPVSPSGLGDDFMRAVFSLEVGQVGTAVDQPQAFVYVVKIVHEQLTDEQRREQFFMSGYTPELNTLVQMEQADLIRDWFDRVEQELELEWKREPVAVSRFE